MEVNNKNRGVGACSICSCQRKKCQQDCIFRTHFPTSRFDEAKQVKKVFGVANVTKMLKQGAPNSSEADIVESLYWEANSWANDPDHGPYGLFKNQQVEILQLKNDSLMKDMYISWMHDQMVAAGIVNGHVDEPVSTSDGEEDCKGVEVMEFVPSDVHVTHSC